MLWWLTIRAAIADCMRMQIPPTHRAGLSGGFVIGALRQIINELGARVGFPIGDVVSGAPPGDLLEPRGPGQRAGADAIEQMVDRITGRRDVDPQAARLDRPLLTTATITSTARSTTRLTVQASAPGADWGQAARASAMVAVYVNGRYHSTIVVLGERPAEYEVNLGAMPAGSHTIELRAATDVAPVPARVGAISAQAAIGEQALIDRLAPVIELRDADPGRRASTSYSDAPLLLVPALTRHPDGTRTIEYRVIWSNEEGGTPPKSLFTKYGRGVDAEPLYRVKVDAEGRVVEASYQSPLHRWLPFDGSYDATGRPVLRISTANNLSSTRSGNGRVTERWSQVATATITGADTEFQTMVANPWTWTVMAKELLREGKAAGPSADAVRGAQIVADPRRYVYLGPLDDVMRATMQLRGGLELVMADGSRVLAKVAKGFASGNGQTALQLPVGAVSAAVRGVALLGVRAVVLDDRLVARELGYVAA